MEGCRGLLPRGSQTSRSLGRGVPVGRVPAALAVNASSGGGGDPRAHPQALGWPGGGAIGHSLQSRWKVMEHGGEGSAEQEGGGLGWAPHL